MGGAEWSKQSRDVIDHDFPDKELGKFAPYGVHDMAANAGWVNVGISADTAMFAVESIRRWWNHVGVQTLPRRHGTADHRGCGRVKRDPAAAVEDRARQPRLRDRPGDHRGPLPARHLEVEQD